MLPPKELTKVFWVFIFLTCAVAHDWMIMGREKQRAIMLFLKSKVEQNDKES